MFREYELWRGGGHEKVLIADDDIGSIRTEGHYPPAVTIFTRNGGPNYLVKRDYADVAKPILATQAEQGVANGKKE